MPKLLRSRVARVLVASITVAGALSACGSGDTAPPGAPTETPSDSGPNNTGSETGFMVPVGSPCTEGAMKDCKVLLPAHGSIHPCFVGVQICSDGKWGLCVDRPEAGTSADGSAVK